MSLKKLIVLVLVVFCNSTAFAEHLIPAGDLNTLYFHSSHSGLIITHTTMINPDSCSRADYYILPQSNPHYKEIYSLLLAAQMANKKVTIFLQNCYQGFPSIAHVILYKQ